MSVGWGISDIVPIGLTTNRYSMLSIFASRLSYLITLSQEFYCVVLKVFTTRIRYNY